MIKKFLKTLKKFFKLNPQQEIHLAEHIIPDEFAWQEDVERWS